ncbi:MAG TPA: TlpA disulfide reductase family protein [Thermoanaerobaculia bacterium]|nr:TlpA disulfide reductase family protein [Thermoanaerobaculia bacterium]
MSPFPPISRAPARAALVVATALAAALGASCFADGAPAERGAAAAEVGPPVPDFRLPTADGRDLGPADLRGRVVLYEFWATWCAPCHIQVEILRKLYPELTRRGVEFVGIASGEPPEVVLEHLERSPSPYPIVLDAEDRVGAAMDVLGLPTLVVADRAGRVVWRNTGLVDEATLRDAFAAAGLGAR